MTPNLAFLGELASAFGASEPPGAAAGGAATGLCPAAANNRPFSCRDGLGVGGELLDSGFDRCGFRVLGRPRPCAFGLGRNRDFQLRFGAMEPGLGRGKPFAQDLLGARTLFGFDAQC